MARPPQQQYKLTPEAKRLAIVFSEYEGPQLAFCKVLTISQSTLSKMLNSIYPVTLPVIKAVCNKLGYSPEWFINGKGEKKRKPGDVKLLTEIAMLRTEMDIMLQLNMRLQARMESYELELEKTKVSQPVSTK
jgi:transcriptional regulator with XRE-family HTH domain